MNWIIIILGTLLVFLIYVLYGYMTNTTVILNRSANLNIKNQTITVSNNSPSYTYSIWININSLPANDTNIFSCGNDLWLSISKDSPTLACKFATNNSYKTDIITNNFPLQKWTFITISVDNQYVDYYLNGKLVKSIYNENPLKLPNTTAIDLGILNANVSLFNFTDNASDPQTVWNTYLKGNGQSSISSLNSFNMKVSLLKDQVEQSKFSLF